MTMSITQVITYSGMAVAALMMVSSMMLMMMLMVVMMAMMVVVMVMKLETPLLICDCQHWPKIWMHWNVGKCQNLKIRNTEQASKMSKCETFEMFEKCQNLKMWNFEKASFLWLAVSLGRKASLGNQYGEFASNEDWSLSLSLQWRLKMTKHLVGWMLAQSGALYYISLESCPVIA